MTNTKEDYIAQLQKALGKKPTPVAVPQPTPQDMSSAAREQAMEQIRAMLKAEHEAEYKPVELTPEILKSLVDEHVKAGRTQEEGLQAVAALMEARAKNVGVETEETKMLKAILNRADTHEYANALASAMPIIEEINATPYLGVESEPAIQKENKLVTVGILKRADLYEASMSTTEIEAKKNALEFQKSGKWPTKSRHFNSMEGQNSNVAGSR